MRRRNIHWTAQNHPGSSLPIGWWVGTDTGRGATWAHNTSSPLHAQQNKQYEQHGQKGHFSVTCLAEVFFFTLHGSCIQDLVIYFSSMLSVRWCQIFFTFTQLLPAHLLRWALNSSDIFEPLEFQHCFFSMPLCAIPSLSFLFLHALPNHLSKFYTPKLRNDVHTLHHKHHQTTPYISEGFLNRGIRIIWFCAIHLRRKHPPEKSSTTTVMVSTGDKRENELAHKVPYTTSEIYALILCTK